MFASIYKSLVEPFTTFTTTANEPHKSQETLRYYYGDKRPNAILGRSSDEGTDFAAATTTYMGSAFDETGNTRLSKRQPALENKWLLTSNSMSGDLISQRQAACEGSGGDTFTHLSNLAANVNPKTKFRCGWIYNESMPSSGRGAYGTMDGPVKTTAQGTWMWDLNDAKKKYHLKICSAITSCEDLDNDAYRNKCGFCKSTKKGVPISGSGVAYPYDPQGACSSANLVTTKSQCPRPTPPPAPGTPAAAAYMETKQTCDPLPGGKYPRDCYVKKAQQAGCSDDGTLIAALRSGSDTNYLDTLTGQPSYQKYQDLSAVTMSESSLKSGKSTATDALSEFSAIQENAASAANQGLKAAAADLCFTSGLFEEYDFCTELQPSSPTMSAPLECLQAEFKRAGGQETGTMYPTASNLASWTSKPKWLDVQEYIKELKAKTSSPTRTVQLDAVSKFYGIKMDRPINISNLGYLNNVEIFWFTPDPDVKNGSSTYNTTFLGRRIRATIPRLDGSATSNNSFLYFTNMKPSSATTLNLRFTGDSGFIFLKNGLIANTYVNTNGSDTTNQEFSSLYPSFGNPASQMTTGQPWTFGATDNIITGYYIGNGKNYKMEFKVGGEIPGAPCFCYGRTENGIRLYSKGECDSLGGNWYGNGECIKVGGGSWSAQCGGVNNATCVPESPLNKTWNEAPSSNLYLIQHPYAPMIKFSTRSNYAAYGCDYAFCDKRLSSHKMKFKIYQSSGPSPTYIADDPDVTTPTYNLDKSYMRFVNGSGIYSLFFIKLYSFMTMAIKIKFNSLPSQGVNATPMILWPTYPSLDFPALILTGTGGNTAKLGVGAAWNLSTAQTGQSAYGVISPGMSTDGPTVTTNVEYIITLKSVRTTESDISSLVGLKVGAAKVSDLQTNPSSFKESSTVMWPNKLHLENKDSNIGRMFFIKADASVTFDIYSIELYDYVLAGDNLQRAANVDWPQGPQGLNPYK